jgi:hypothetical protein
MDLPDPLPLSADEITAIAHAARLTDACEPILIEPLRAQHPEPRSQARIWLVHLEIVEFDPAIRAEFDAKFGPRFSDHDAARQAIPLWRSIECWHHAHCGRNPRYAQRHLMSDLSEEAYCASWHYDTEFRLWELITGARDAWMCLDNTDPRLRELTRLHNETGGWWWRNDALDGGWGKLEFLPTDQWERVYTLRLNDPNRTTCAVIDGKLLKGDAAVDALINLIKHK